MKYGKILIMLVIVGAAYYAGNVVSDKLAKSL